MRYLWIAAAVIVALIIIVVAVGYSLPVKHTASAEQTYRATPDAIYALITQTDQFTAWRTGVKKVETVTRSDGRRGFRETADGNEIEYVIEDAQPGKRLVTRIANKLPFGGSWTYELIPAQADHTTLRITENGEVYNPVFRFVSKLILRHETTILTYLSDVKKRFPD